MATGSLTVQPAWKGYFVFYAAIIILGLGPQLNPEAFLGREAGLLIAALLIAFVYLKRKHTYYRFSAEGVSKELHWGGRGLTQKIPLADLSSVSVRRGVVHRLIDVGHLQFRVKDIDGGDLWWYGVDQPFVLKREIDALIGSVQSR